MKKYVPISLLFFAGTVAFSHTEETTKIESDKSSKQTQSASPTKRSSKHKPKKKPVSLPKQKWQNNNCKLSLTDTQTLAGTEWLAFVNDAEKGEYAESKYRMKFYDNDGDLAL